MPGIIALKSRFAPNGTFSAPAVCLLPNETCRASSSRDLYLRKTLALAIHMNGSYVPILLKNSIKMKVCFSANNQAIMNFPQQLVCEFTSGSVGRDR
jgi:hypothetical protein